MTLDQRSPPEADPPSACPIATQVASAPSRTAIEMADRARCHALPVYELEVGDHVALIGAQHAELRLGDDTASLLPGSGLVRELSEGPGDAPHLGVPSEVSDLGRLEIRRREAFQCLLGLAPRAGLR